MGKAYTTISDLRQAAEGEIVSGPQSQLSLPGGISVSAGGAGSHVSITGTTPMDSQKTFETMVSSADSTLGKVLGITGQLAQGLFEQTPAAKAALAAGQPQEVFGSPPAADNKLLLIGGGLLLLFLLVK